MENLKDLKKVKSIDIEKYDGVKTKIEKVELLDVQEKEFIKGEGLKEVRQILIETENFSDDESIKITCKEWISLKKDKDGEWGIPDSKLSNATKILSFFEVKSFDELIGKECRVLRKVKGDKKVLGIHFG